jgi:CheY-like chemotaxis protein/anti-sigma regulatory factor (Ser/Thr protein kinase)
MMTTVFEIAKLDQGAMRPNVGAVDVGSLFDRVADQVRPLAEAKGLSFSFFRPRCSIWTDPTYMRRILQNLLSNAIKYTRRGKVLLGARHQGDSLRLEVWDTGIGIEAHQRTAIFDDFFRVDAVGERGSGLGLGVVSRMAGALGHPVEVRSWPGRGSCFSVCATRAPMAPARRPRAPDQPSETHSLAGALLYLDDEPENLSAMRALVEAWGVEFVGAQRLEDALAAASSTPRPCMLVVDYQLRAKETGLEAARRLRSALGADVPTVIVTADRQPALKAAARSAGYSYLSKPVRPAALKTLLRRAHGSRTASKVVAPPAQDLPDGTGASSRKN